MTTPDPTLPEVSADTGLREQIGRTLINAAHDFGHAGSIMVNTAQATDAVLAVVAPLLAERDIEIERLRGKRDALSLRLRGMARRLGEVRDEMRFATRHIGQWQRVAQRLRSQRDGARAALAASPAIPHDAATILRAYLSGWLPAHFDKPEGWFDMAALKLAESLAEDVLPEWFTAPATDPAPAAAREPLVWQEGDPEPEGVTEVIGRRTGRHWHRGFDPHTNSGRWISGATTGWCAWSTLLMSELRATEVLHPTAPQATAEPADDFECGTATPDGLCRYFADGRHRCCVAPLGNTAHGTREHQHACMCGFEWTTTPLDDLSGPLSGPLRGEASGAPAGTEVQP